MTGEAIFDKMIHYESDQLAKVPSTNDYRCKLTETTVNAGSLQRGIVDKTVYFMVPMFQLQTTMVEPSPPEYGSPPAEPQQLIEQPVLYSDQDQELYFLDSRKLTKEKDTVINNVPCYAITLTPLNPVYKAYYATYSIAKDDFRHIRTVSHHASDTMDNLVTEIDYTYGTFNGFNLLKETVAITKSDKGAFGRHHDR